jgi:hypothetical protein
MHIRCIYIYRYIHTCIHTYIHFIHIPSPLYSYYVSINDPLSLVYHCHLRDGSAAATCWKACGLLLVRPPCSVYLQHWCFGGRTNWKCLEHLKLNRFLRIYCGHFVENLKLNGHLWKHCGLWNISTIGAFWLIYCIYAF